MIIESPLRGNGEEGCRGEMSPGVVALVRCPIGHADGWAALLGIETASMPVGRVS